MFKDQEVRWYDKKDPSKRSIIERLLYNLIIAPIIRKKYRKIEEEKRLYINGIDNLVMAIDMCKMFSISLVVVSNHIDENDTTLIPYIIDKYGKSPCFKIAKLELFENWLGRLTMWCSGARPIDRDAGFRDLNIIEKLIKEQKIILVFPTGHRDPNNKTPVNIGLPKVLGEHISKVAILPIEVSDTDLLKAGGNAFVCIKQIIYLNSLGIPEGRRGYMKIMEVIAKSINVPMPERKKDKGNSGQKAGV